MLNFVLTTSLWSRWCSGKRPALNLLTQIHTVYLFVLTPLMMYFTISSSLCTLFRILSVRVVYIEPFVVILYVGTPTQLYSELAHNSYNHMQIMYSSDLLKNHIIVICCCDYASWYVYMCIMYVCINIYHYYIKPPYISHIITINLVPIARCTLITHVTPVLEWRRLTHDYAIRIHVRLYRSHTSLSREWSQCAICNRDPEMTVYARHASHAPCMCSRISC